MKMFDKLIESDSAKADFKPRARYFTVSTTVIAILFSAVVVVSLYAQDISLGTDSFDIAELLVPLAPEAPETSELVRPNRRVQPQQQSDILQRQANIMRIDESPAIPDKISSTPGNYQSRPESDFILSKIDTNPGGPPAGPSTGGTGTGSMPNVESAEPATAPTAVVPPPPNAVRTRKPPVQSLGVITGKATFLPKPAYTAAMRALNINGEVSVQVTVDENGNVVSSKAVSGHPMLRGAAEKAALGARFSTTYLSKVPVKVTGVIVYRFTR